MVPENYRYLPGTTSFSKLAEYFSIRDEIDSLCLKLEEIHKEHFACSPGCHKCCMDFSIFPIEFYSILKEKNGQKTSINQNTSGEDCVFLIEGLCTIYKSRPVICRTHGLPLLFMGEDQWELSYCELNFTGRNMPDLNESNTFPQDRFNSSLFMINREFVNSLENKPYSETDLIPLKDLGVLIGRSN
jgi:uncharacterized protein